MRYSNNWQDYELLDASCGERLERWGDIFLIRPDPQVIWQTKKENPLWNTPHAKYHRSDKGGGYWEEFKPVPDRWSINYKNLTFNLKPMGFKHTGLFPEQAVNWDLTAEIIKKAKKPFKLLNLFAYTGGATVSALSAGAEVVHVDASKGMTAWAKENVISSNLSERAVRFFVDDCKKLIEREIRRGNKYDGIIMDPPSYGRGPSGEIWKLETEIHDLASKTAQLLHENSKFFIINSYTTGLSPAVMEYILGLCIKPLYGGEIKSDEIGIPVVSTGMILPCGNTAIWRK